MKEFLSIPTCESDPSQIIFLGINIDDYIFVTQLLVTSVFPSLLIITGNVAIVACLVYRYKLAREMTSNNGDDHMSWITINLMVVSIVFLALTLPHGISIFLTPHIWGTENMLGNLKGINLIHGFRLMLYLNYGINFWLYCMTGRMFRQKVRQMFCGVMRRLQCKCCKTNAEMIVPTPARQAV